MSSKPGRNDPCPCGSGKKYKACHAAEDRERDAPPPSQPHTLNSDLHAADIPLRDSPFHVQFREWSAHHRELASKFEALTRLAEEELSPEALEALQKAREGDPEALLQHVQSDPRLVERISREAKERS